MKDLKGISVFLISMCFYSCAEFQYASQVAYEKKNKTSDFCPKFYGKWEACNSYSETYPKKKKSIWNFDINGTLRVDDHTFVYRLEQNCSKLFIDNNAAYSSIEIRKDTLFIKGSDSFFSEYPLVLKLKKLN